MVIGYQEKAGQRIDLKAYYTLIAPDGKKMLNRKLFSQAKSKLPITKDLIKLNPHLVVSFDTEPPGKYKVEIEIKEGKKASRAAVYLVLSDEIRENMPQTLTAKEWFDKGMELSSSNDYKGAIEAFTKAIRLDRTYTLAYHKRGLRYMTIGKDLRAISDLMAAAQLGHKDSQEYLKIMNLKY
jgi:tetratricopeptide (TPR) repeat protein